MEQKGKKYEELNAYEKAVTNTLMEQKLEAALNEMENIRKAMGFHSIVCTALNETDPTVVIWLDMDEKSVLRKVTGDGSLIGFVKEALEKRETD